MGPYSCSCNIAVEDPIVDCACGISCSSMAHGYKWLICCNRNTLRSSREVHHRVCSSDRSKHLVSTYSDVKDCGGCCACVEPNCYCHTCSLCHALLNIQSDSSLICSIDEHDISICSSNSWCSIRTNKRWIGTAIAFFTIAKHWIILKRSIHMTATLSPDRWQIDERYSKTAIFEHSSTCCCLIFICCIYERVSEWKSWIESICCKTIEERCCC